MSAIQEQVRKRRTFAIISHPDAGKTTLTEKLLLYGGAIQLAGTVKGRKASRHATSDWMRLEQERGISVTSSVMQFPYNGQIVNLLDTPGHEDFSEDTYRVLSAVDAVVMVLDSAKGIEPQTLKLFEVCRSRNLPVITFLNKLDRPGMEPLELLDQIEEQIGLRPTPATWPVGSFGDLRGVIDRRTDIFTRFTRTARGSQIAPEEDVPAERAAVEAMAQSDHIGRLSTLAARRALGQAGDGAVHTAAGHHLIASFQIVEKILLFLCLFLLRADEQKIEDHKNQDDRDKLAEGGKTATCCRCGCAALSKCNSKHEILREMIKRSAIQPAAAI